MKVLIVGAGGRLGKMLTSEALKQGHEVTALVRDFKQLSGLQNQRLKIVKGDVLHIGQLDIPMEAQQAVICSLGVKGTREKVTALSQGTDNLIRAMQRHNVRRLLCITGVGAGDSRGHGGFIYDRFIQPLFLKSIYEDKNRQERLVERSDRDWMLIRPARLTDGPASSPFSAVQTVRGLRAGKMSRAGLAKWTVQQLQVNRFLYRAVVLTD